MLARSLGEPWSTRDFFRVAIALTHALDALGGVAHRALDPEHITYARATGTVSLERGASASPPYLAPEQTGRLNRTVDTRSDLYALGVIFHELLTGEKPFSAHTPSEWAHRHVAHAPAPLPERVPKSVIAIVGRLLAKNPDERYQTAAGLAFDLERASEGGDVELGTRDLSGRLRLPDRRYGRASDLRTLRDARDRTAQNGGLELAWIGGPPGIGKSALVSEVERDAAATNGRFATGKYDQLKREIPYATLARALGSLVQDALRAPEAEIAILARDLRAALGENTRLVTELVGELTRLVGEGPPLPEATPHEAAMRMHHALAQTLAAFATPSRPVTLFLDDLQWAEQATLDFLRFLLVGARVAHVFVIGAYRDTEVPPDHPLARLMADVRGPRVHSLQLGPLGPAHVGQLLADTLRLPLAEVTELAALVHDKTGGNPLFLAQLVSMLADAGLLALSHGRWTWDIQRLRAEGLTDDVIRLMIERLRRLPADLRRSLALLACIGHTGSRALLARADRCTEEDIQARFVTALAAGTVTATDTGYAFAHDRVQEAAIALVTPEERDAMHLAIARAFGEADHVFEIASQYNRVLSLVTDAAERTRVVALNLDAAQQARRGGAYGAAAVYAAVADDLEPAFTSAFLRAECAYALGDPDAAEARLAELAQRITRPDLLGDVARLRAEVAFANARPDRAVAFCVDHLNSIGIAWPARPSAAELRAEYDRFIAAIPPDGIQAFAELPALTDRDILALMDVLLACLSAAAVLPDRSGHHFTVLRMMNLGIAHGNGRAAAIVYARAAMVLPACFDDWTRAIELGRLALTLVERPGFEYQRARVIHTVHAQVLPWVEPPAPYRAAFLRAHRLAVEAGDLAFSGITLLGASTVAVAACDPLTDALRELEKARAFIESSRFAMMITATSPDLMFVKRLLGMPFEPLSEAVRADPRLTLNVVGYEMRAVSAALFLNELDEAFALIPKVIAQRDVCATYPQRGDFEIHAALAYARIGDREAMRNHAPFVHVWGANGPAFRAASELLAAEEARLEGLFEVAERSYALAIASARHESNLALEGLALDAAARFYEGTERPVVAEQLRAETRACWERWGATALITTAAKEPVHDAGSLDDIDVTTMIALAHAVSSEIVLDRLVERLMTLALEHAGASRAVLLLPEGGELRVAADTSGTKQLPESLLRFVSRTHESVIIDDALANGPYRSDPYFEHRRVRAVLVLPLVTESRLGGVLYLENDLTSHVFTEARLGLLELFVAQAAIALENARLLADLRRTEHHRIEAQRLSNTGSFSWDLETNEMRWSEQIYAIYEYPKSRAVTEAQLTERAHPRDRDRAISVLHASGDVDHELELVLPDGRTKTVQIVARRQNGRLAGAIVDVTQRRRDEQRLRDAQRRFAVTVASIADGVIATAADGTITYVNPVAQELVEIARVGAPIARILDLAARTGIEARVSPLAAPEGAVVVLRDTTLRRRAEEALALAAANERLETALRGSNLGLWDFDYHDPNASPPPLHVLNFWESLGWPAPPLEDREAYARTYRPDRFHPGDRALLYEKFAEHRRGDLPEIRQELRAMAPDGSWRWVLYRAQAVRDSAGRATRLIGTTMDVTERRHLEDEIRRATQVADTANRAKDAFLANVSHEIRTPMNAILGMTELALDTTLSNEQRHWLATVKSAADNLLVIIDELLDFSKAEANKLELTLGELDIRGELEALLRGMATAAHGKNLALLLDVADDVPERLEGDVVRLRQILTNLVGNAIKFTSAGEVVVSVRRVDDVELAFAVRDTGIGIPADKHALVFEPFAQADVSTTREFGGTGLGLSIAMRLAALMSGRVDVESVPGHGSTFTLRARFGRVAHAAPVAFRFPAPARVLVVDASEAQRLLVARWLTEAGLRVTTAASGVSAMDVLWDGVVSRDPVALVLVELPDGARLASLIQERSALASCVVIPTPLARPLGKRELLATVAEGLGAAQAVPAPPPTPTPARAPGASLRILVAEDSEFNADLIRELLRRRGHDAAIVDNGHAVLDAVAKGGFDLLLLDLHMPGLDGFQVIERIRARERETNRHLPVVAVTARSRAEDRAQCLAAGMDAFLGKPIRSAALWETIDRLLRDLAPT